MRRRLRVRKKNRPGRHVQDLFRRNPLRLPASLFVDFEEKLREYNPELADKLNAYEELAQHQWDEKSALGREKFIEGRDKFVPYAQEKFYQGREKVVPFAKEQWTRGNEKFGELRSAAYDRWASYRAREDELAD